MKVKFFLKKAKGFGFLVATSNEEAKNGSFFHVNVN